jgi:hypothetical protein
VKVTEKIKILDNPSIGTSRILAQPAIQTSKCPLAAMCMDWSCKQWCECFDEKVNYASFGCGDDGIDTCKCN